MADYEVAGVHSLAGNGSYIVPEHWVPKFGALLAQNACWSPFVTGDIDGAKLLAAGAGDTVRCNFFGDISIPTADITEGTFSPNGTQNAYQVALTVSTYGQKVPITAAELFLVGEDPVRSKALESIMYNAIQAWEYRIGGAALGAAYNFDCRSSTSLVQSAAAGGTGGTTYLLPFHMRALGAWAKRHNIPTWRSVGKPYDHVIVGPAGMFGAIASQTEFLQIAALQNPEFYANGALGVYNGFLCIEETCVARCTYSTTAGTGVVMFGPGILGDTTVGKSPNTFATWSDTRDFPGALNYVGWYGHYALGLVPDLGTIGRIQTIHAKCE